MGQKSKTSQSNQERCQRSLCTACGMYLAVTFMSHNLWLVIFLMCPPPPRDQSYLLSQICELLRPKAGKDYIPREMQMREQGVIELEISKENILVQLPGLASPCIVGRDRDWEHFESRVRNGVLGHKNIWAGILKRIPTALPVLL